MVVTCVCEDAAEALKGRHVGEVLTVIPEGTISSCIILLCGYPLFLMLYPLGAQGGFGVVAIEGLSRYENVKAGAARMGVVSLVHNHRVVLHMVVKKIIERFFWIISLP